MAGRGRFSSRKDAPGPVAPVAREAKAQSPDDMLTVRAVKRGQDYTSTLRQPGEVFRTPRKFFSDSTKERVLSRLDKNGEPIRTGQYGWMELVTPESAAPVPADAHDSGETPGGSVI